MSKPNIFRIATKELSQDGFFTWLIQWADKSNKEYDKELHQTAIDFVNLLTNNLMQISDVSAGRQWKNIDIWVELNDDTFIAIEDKTITGEHSEQLERYKQIVTDHYKNKRNNLVFIYLKTGNESISTVDKIKEKGFTVIDRKAVLSVLNRSKSENNIFTEFRDNLNEIETRTNSFNKFENIVSDWKAAEGFFIKLQELILPEWSDWRYVANQTGGFLGFWYCWTGCDNYCLHIQIENALDYGIKLVIKIDDWEPNIDTMYSALSKLHSDAKDIGLSIIKPDRFRAGETSTLAIVENAFPVNSDGNIEITEFTKTLKKLEDLLKKHSMDKKE